MIRLPLCILLVVAALMPGACNIARFKATTTTVSTVEPIDDAPIRVETRNGSIEIVASSQYAEVTVEARLTCGGRSQLEADERLMRVSIEVARDTTRTLVIRPVFPEPRRQGDAASIVVHLPNAKGVSATSSNGAVAVTGTHGEITAQSSNGRITITDHVGPAKVTTSNGRITFVNHDGTIDAGTSNGRITVSLGPDATAPMKLKTSNGSITVNLPGMYDGRMTMSTSNGAVTVMDSAERITQRDLTRKGGSIVIGSGSGETSTMRTSNGKIAVTIGG